MNNSKFWVWFIPLFIIMCVCIYILVNTSNKINNNENTAVVNKDAVIIKEEYEKLNNESIKVELSENNSYFYASEDDVKNLLEKEDGILYLGEVSSFAARKTINLLDNAVSTTSINKVYYVEISKINDEYKEYLLSKLDVKEINAGDTYTIQDGNKVNNLIAKEYDDDKEFSDKQKEEITKQYQELIIDLIEKCDENC